MLWCSYPHPLFLSLLALILCHNSLTYLHCPISSAVVQIFSSWAFEWRDAAVWPCQAVPLDPSSVFLKLTLSSICLISPRSDQLSGSHLRISYSWDNLKHVPYSLRWFDFSAQFISTVFDCCCRMKKNKRWQNDRSVGLKSSLGVSGSVPAWSRAVTNTKPRQPRPSAANSWRYPRVDFPPPLQRAVPEQEPCMGSCFAIPYGFLGFWKSSVLLAENSRTLCFFIWTLSIVPWRLCKQCPLPEWHSYSDIKLSYLPVSSQSQDLIESCNRRILRIGRDL